MWHCDEMVSVQTNCHTFVSLSTASGTRATQLQLKDNEVNPRGPNTRLYHDIIVLTLNGIGSSNQLEKLPHFQCITDFPLSVDICIIIVLRICTVFRRVPSLPF